MHKFDPAKIEILMNEERKRELYPLVFLRSNGLSSGMSFADIGCGPGFFTLPASEVVGSKGKVYAVDIQKEMLKELQKRNPDRNVHVILSTENSIPVEDAVCDMVFTAFVFHEASDKPAFLQELKRLLRNNGKLLLLDWQKKEEEQGPPFEERIDILEAEELMKAAGFKIEEKGNLSTSYYKIKGIKEKR